jgi:hypothetical protein
MRGTMRRYNGLRLRCTPEGRSRLYAWSSAPKTRMPFTLAFPYGKRFYSISLLSITPERIATRQGEMTIRRKVPAMSTSCMMFDLREAFVTLIADRTRVSPLEVFRKTAKVVCRRTKAPGRTDPVGALRKIAEVITGTTKGGNYPALR